MALPYVTEAQVIKLIEAITSGGSGGGSSSGFSIFDMTESQVADQSVLAEIYNTCPMVLRVTTASDGIQMYQLQYDTRTERDEVVFACLISGTLIQLSIKEKEGVYSVEPVSYPQTPANS